MCRAFALVKVAILRCKKVNKKKEGKKKRVVKVMH